MFPKDEEGKNSISWFWLTDSNYFIELGEVKLFEVSSQWQEKYKKENGFDDYYYIRQLEDFFDIIPVIGCPIPDDLYLLIETEEKREALEDAVTEWYFSFSESSAKEDEIYDLLSNLIGYGHLDTGYLRYKSDCCFFHVDGQVIIQYNFTDKDEEGCPVWSAGKGTYRLTYEAFLGKIEDLLTRFFAAMDQQVKDAIKVFNESELYPAFDQLRQKQRREKSGFDLLNEEHAQRKEYFNSMLELLKSNAYKNQIDWQKVRKCLINVQIY